MNTFKIEPTSRDRYVKWTLALILSLPLALASCDDNGQYEVETFNLGNARSIEILASEHLEVTQSFYYQVKVDQKVVVRLGLMCVGIDRGQLKFGTLLAKSGDLVGVFEKKYPQEILAIHDFRTNITWPGIPADGGPERYQDHGASLLRELQSEHPERTLTMAQDNCGR